jgi:hypothetical protein
MFFAVCGYPVSCACQTACSPYPGDTYNITSGTVMLLCQIISTSSYCADTMEQVRLHHCCCCLSSSSGHVSSCCIDQLTESLRRQIDPVFAEHIVLADVEEYLKFDLVAAALKALVRYVQPSHRDDDSAAACMKNVCIWCFPVNSPAELRPCSTRP